MSRRARSDVSATTPSPTDGAAVSPNGQPAADQGALVQLARLVVEMERKGDIMAQLARRIDALRPLRMVPVEGEIALQQRLVDLLQRARALVRQLSTAADTATATQALAQLNDLLSDVQWELLEDTIRRLAAKQRQQDDLLQGYKSQVDGYRVEVNRLRMALDQAAQVRAPVRAYVDRLRRIEARLMQADRTLVNFEQPFPLLAEAIKALREETEPLDNELKAIDEITQRTERFARNAELSLIQSPLDLYGRHQYEVGLRTTGEAGAHGLSVKASIKLVQQDRELLRHAIKQITTVVKGGNRKAQQQTTKDDTEDALASTESFSLVENEATRAAIRAYIFGDEGPTEEPAVPLTSLVREMGDLMFRLFLPEEVQENLRTNTCSLTVATNDLELPWEFMYYDPTPNSPEMQAAGEEDEANFLCLSRPVARQLLGRPIPGGRPPRSERPARRQFLFIANPTGDLAGAEREVETVTEALRADWPDQIEVTVLRGKEATGRRLNQLLRSDRYDVIHYSGHAFFDDNDPDYSGLLLHNQEIFFADKIRRLLGGRPLVFLNACESASAANEGRAAVTFGYNLQKPAQGLAASFVYGGALGCIGSLWPINDVRAARFAVEFYNQVLDGVMIGESLRRARVHVKSTSPQEVTWAAFVLYGDPTFRLVD
ncbi:MAG: hypothetical protein DCC55_13420 [Chloroflexi bacterium]|nr:MAG: hypothetical protein DCC55_13420 [Chloroflexota bacterium]